jgi:hypothetical protein
MINDLRWTGRILIAALAMCMIGGCGSSPEGPPRFQISGRVTFDGKPVPKGFISFEPDTQAGNKGPGGGAPILNGQYKTERERGVVGGPHLVRIVGYGGVSETVEGEQLADGKPLFETFETKFDFPKQHGTADFQVPKPE